MSGRVGPAVASVVLARIGDYEPYDPELERYKAEEHRKRAEQAEIERQKLCVQLSSETPEGRLSSLVRSARLWFNSCPKPAPQPEASKPESAKQVEQPRQTTPSFLEVKFSGR